MPLKLESFVNGSTAFMKDETVGLPVDGTNTKSKSETPQKSLRLRATVWTAIVLCVLSTTLNILLLHFDTESKTVRHEDLLQVERPNQYIGLDTVKRPSPPTPREFIKYPLVMTQINSSSPNQVFSDDPKRWLSQSGMLSPEDRRLLVSPTVSTIAQFRAIDYGMEDCELSVVVQTPNEDLDPDTAMYDSQLKLGQVRNTIEIWRLRSPTIYSTKQLSWATRPKREEKLATIDVREGIEYTYRFHCPSDTTHAFELSAAPTDNRCHVEWWQDKINPPSAIYMRQRASI